MPPERPFAVWCFLGCGYFTDQPGRFSQSFDDAKIFHRFDSKAVDFCIDSCSLLLSDFDESLKGSFQARVFVQFVEV